MPYPYARTPEPGDPDFNWSRYDQYKASTHDPVALAQEFLDRPDPLNQRPTNRVAAKDFIAENNMPTGAPPQVGEQRHGETESVQWDGSRWAPIARNPSAEAGYHPGLATDPTSASLQGFLSGASEAATPGKIGALAAMLVPGMAPAILTGAGAMAGTDMLRRLFDTANAPTGMGDLGRDVVESAMPSAVGGAINAIPDTALTIGSFIPGKIGMAAKALKAARGMRGAASATTSVAEGEMGGFAGQPGRSSSEVRSYRYQDSPPVRPTEDFWPPQGPTTPSSGPAPRLVKGAAGGGLESTLDDMLQGLRGEGGAASRGTLPPEPTITPAGKEGSFQSTGRPSVGQDWYRGGGTPTPSAPPAPRSMGPDELANIDRNTTFGEGGVMQGPLPTELRSSAVDGLEFPQSKPYDAGYYGLKPTPRGQIDLLEGGPESGRFPIPGREGQDVPSADDVETLISQLRPSSQSVSPVSPSLQMPPSMRSLARGDEYWGQGALSRGGAPAQAGEGGQFLYDPQTPTAYLREQLKHATDPAEREWLTRTIRQRYDINSRPGAFGPSKYASPSSSVPR